MSFSFAYIVLLAFSLATDAFAVSIASGISIPEKNLLKKALAISLFFGAFQTFMPVIGFFIGSSFSRSVSSAGEYLAFTILFFIGAKMIYTSLKNSCECPVSPSNIAIKQLLALSFATSIDAFAAGISISVIYPSIFLPAVVIGTITFILSFAGVLSGSKLGCKFGNRMETAGGIILILLSINILL